MNNLLGAIGLTLIIAMPVYIYILKHKIKNTKSVIISQSMLQHRYSSRARNPRKIKTKTQSQTHYDKTNVKVIIVDDNAYWIKDNIFYKAPMVDNLIDKESVEEVDTIHMDRVQLDKMLFIMDKLREGINDDSRGSWN